MASDLIVIGGGIVGLSTAWQLLKAHPGLAVTVLEKETEVARHQSGHNSGVIHAGVYYQPGSLKARFCKEGVEATIAFSREHGIAFEQCGKLLVATGEDERERMIALHARCLENGLDATLLDRAALRALEPNIEGVGAIRVPTTGIADYPAIARRMAEEIARLGGEVRTGVEVVGISESANDVRVELAAANGVGEHLTARHLVACGGLMADRLARFCGIAADFSIVPFRGEYFRLPSHLDGIVSHLIYPIPDPALPFLGVHLTRMIGGYVTVGPNAVLAFAREGYRFGDVSARDLAAMARFGGFWRLIGRNLGPACNEMWSSLSRRRYLALCRRYCPSLELDDLQPYPAGVRAQAVAADGTMIHDFLIRETARSLHVCNAPSPAATSAIPIGRHLVARAGDLFGLGA
ncbi:L-2-hydroxyglutarate oxidase [Oceanibacterium hippocampi]|uniref:L-2-hydroxyglutarate oxidase LhgO n=1 Tax=Oceanibacterium hippocampi TaxID=745714 RepID=A0A1Y5TC79_9PROT|nr:L-2-hydroxyglutarate oxidase [Oceanibacterium hippocampi]SLN60642.1 L-2-hydroxyglutarate oxidase LhgO [Oceanibacterium hippocampi]